MSDVRHPMSGGTADAVVFLLVDALRHDYVGRTRFLAATAARSLTGQLEEPFGFCPRGAYFGGLTMAEQGYTNLFRFDPARSPFAWTRELAGGDDGDAALRAALRPGIVSRAKAVVPPFAAMYLDPLDIPLPWLGYFDVCEREGPASATVGYRSLFHQLDARGEPWLDLSWPYLGWTGPLTSGRVAGMALDTLRPAHRFAFVHLPELDMVGHAYGPGSRELQAALEDTDRLCELVCARVAELYRDPVIVIAGDHGMLPVTRRVDVAGALAATGLRFGAEIAYFIDSTMVRLWALTSAALPRALEALGACGGGRVLDAGDWARYGLTGIDDRNGHAVFLADPGVLFSPNFFDWAGTGAVRGMHGYAPDVDDNRAALLIYRPHAPAAGECGVLAARDLHPMFQSWLGLDQSERAVTGPPAATTVDGTTPSPAPGHWSSNGTAASDAVVDAHLAAIVEAVRHRAPDCAAIVLAGGFGRGEGTVVTGPASGRPQPVNDYDIVVVGARAGALDGLDDELGTALGIDFVDLWARPDLTPATPISQFDFDLRYGARLLWGDPLVLDKLPRHAPADLHVDEGIFQIGSRAGGLLLGLVAGPDGPGAADPAGFRDRQRGKFLMALADAWLMAHADYHASYQVRRRRFAALSTGLLPAAVREAVDGAFAAKLTGAALAPVPDAVAQCGEALRHLEAALGWDGDAAVVGDALTRTVARRVRAGHDWLAAAAARGLVGRPLPAAAPTAPATAIYRALLECVRAWADAEPRRRERIAAALAPEFTAATTPSADSSAAVARTWLTFFHP